MAYSSLQRVSSVVNSFVRAKSNGVYNKANGIGCFRLWKIAKLGKVVEEVAFERPTRWGEIPVKHLFQKHAKKSSKLAVLFPGREYPQSAPLMWYAAKSAFSAGYDVLGIEYGYQANRTDLRMDDLDVLVSEAIDAMDQVMPDSYREVTFIGKSLGTMVQASVAQKISFSVGSHVFLTPLKPVIPFIQETQRSLVIVGDCDPLFEATDIPHIANRSNVDVSVIAGANHALETEDVSESIRILGQTATLCEDFLRNAKDGNGG
ncbi:hypothetical protein AYW79_03040 [Ferroacidibacillus organovorans]|uniref:KANL3/Tex30 alpha/beta hydrolase-like domain-containing protein n=1 Tax=Ferroacidibacillus organovorans TaxID=1765683 RepID=A0A853KDL5_9BACL|nr:hypothetical protein AYW79_03040 [Ferroacidibacillus organovorans]